MNKMGDRDEKERCAISLREVEVYARYEILTIESKFLDGVFNDDIWNAQ